jgi:hypothetical protein
MGGAIALFTAIDSSVEIVVTIAGNKLDTVYRRCDSGEWRAELYEQVEITNG